MAINTSNILNEQSINDLISELNLTSDYQNNALHMSQVESPLGQLILITSHSHLFYLDLMNHIDVSIIRNIMRSEDSSLQYARNQVTDHCQQQLEQYFTGTRRTFTIALQPIGTEFQRKTWDQLRLIPYGETCSYSEQSEGSSHRATANANGKNPILIMIPCHRVVRKDGALGGFRSGLSHKKFLLSHEKNTLLAIGQSYVK